MLIQTKERFDFLFRDPKRRPTFSILPNSPIQASFEHHPSEPQHLIYFGLISASHGVESCIEALRCLPDSYRMTLKGPASPAYMTTLELKYREFFESTRLTYEASYLATVEVLPYLSRFAMGFCFYDFNIIARNDFNYVSCPSGKLYSYLAAGIPVIGSDILGLQVVHEKDCGLLLKEPNPEAIAGAVRKIEQDLLAYQKRCRAAATQFDFRDHFSRFYETIPLRERVSVG
jgi:glycosyltransferase involved in cell wall biosynthesis